MKHIAWRALIIIGLVGTVYVVSALLYGTSFTPPRSTQLLTPKANQVSVTITPLEILPSINQVRVTVNVNPGNDFFDPITYRLKDDLSVVVYPGSNESGFLLKAGTDAQDFETTINLDGRIQDYPFDSYESEVAIGVDRIPSDGSPADWVPIVGGFSVPQGLVGWSVETMALDQLEIPSAPEASATATASETLVLSELRISRAGSTIVFAILLLALMVTLAGISVMTAWLLRTRRDSSTPWRPTTIVATLLFALIPIRLFLPGDPPLGSWIDILVFFWVEIALMSSLVVIFGGHIIDRIRLHKIEAQTAHQEAQADEPAPTPPE
jgi:hypothetical protein